MTFKETLRRCQEAAEKAGNSPFVLWPLTDEALEMWRAHRGNVKARRRWRRRNIPNTQRLMSTGTWERGTLSDPRWLTGNAIAVPEGLLKWWEPPHELGRDHAADMRAVCERIKEMLNGH